MARTRALMDLLPWEIFVGEGLLLHADGALSTSFRFRGPDPASSTDDGLTALSRTLVEAFRPLGDGWLLHFDLLRDPAPGYPEAGAFPDPFTAALDAQRRQAYERRETHFLGRQFMTVTWHPEIGSERRSLLDSLLRPDVGRPGLDGRIQDFEAALDEIIGTLSSALRLERLGTAAQLRYLYRCVTFRDHPLAVPATLSGPPAAPGTEATPFTLEHVLGAGDLYGGTDLRFGETHIVPIRLAGFPDAVGPAAFDLLNDLPLPFRATLRYIPLDPHTARAAIKRKRCRLEHHRRRLAPRRRGALLARRRQAGVHRPLRPPDGGRRRRGPARARDPPGLRRVPDGHPLRRRRPTGARPRPGPAAWSST